jgi:hypothetical protein
MDAREFFLERHRTLHAGTFGQILERVPQEQFRVRPHPELNSLAWVLWHVARCEDVGVNRLVADRPQVVHEGGWDHRLGVPLQHIGTGMADEEVTEFTAQVDIQTLCGYWDAVGEQTQEVLGSMRPEEFDGPVDPEHLRRVLYQEGAMGPNAAWIEEALRGGGRAWLLARLGLTHSYVHAGEAGVIGSLLGFKGR